MIPSKDVVRYVDMDLRVQNLKAEIKALEKNMEPLEKQLLTELGVLPEGGRISDGRGYDVTLKPGRKTTEIDVRMLWDATKASKFFDLVKAQVTECRKYVPSIILEKMSTEKVGKPSLDVVRDPLFVAKPQVQEQVGQAVAAEKAKSARRLRV